MLYEFLKLNTHYYYVHGSFLQVKKIIVIEKTPAYYKYVYVQEEDEHRSCIFTSKPPADSFVPIFEDKKQVVEYYRMEIVPETIKQIEKALELV